jgi:hypothetical protein
MENKTQQELVNTIIDAINDGRLNDINVCDIHHEVFNTDYFIIGHYAAEQWLIKNGGVFAAIETIQDYEKSNFGEVNTDLSSAEKVCNMLVYILGEELLNGLSTINNNWDEGTTEELLEELKTELENI